VLKCSYLVTRGFLWCRLPSGRCLAYGKPEIRAIEVPWADQTLPQEKRETKPTPTALGVNSVTKKWERFGLYGGLAFENIVQAIARDILANGIVRAEAADYPVVAHVHDEIITELPRGTGDLDAFCRLICDLPAWAAGLPLSASGWRGKRYRKD
jgi:DNA polymerase